MPIYPALALLLGSALDESAAGRLLDVGTRVAGSIYAAALATISVILYAVRGVPATGDISSALQQHPSAYTLSLGHMGDLTLRSFAYLRTPLLIAAVACAVGTVGALTFARRHAVLAMAVAMLIFFHASRAALVVFDPYLSSRVLAENLSTKPDGVIIIDGAYYPFSSLVYYSGHRALLLNGRFNNLEYGSYAPGAPSVFIDDAQFARLWSSPARYYLATDGTQLAKLKQLVGGANFHSIVESGGKTLLTNHPALASETSERENSLRTW